MKVRILFVCLANICRSPALEATLRHLAVKENVGDQIDVDSCGLGWVHIGERPDPRTFESAKKQGIIIDTRAQQFQEAFFDEFDYILAVNEAIVEQLKARAPKQGCRAKIGLATLFSAKYPGAEIPDPYYMDSKGFDQVMEIAIDSCRGLLLNLLPGHL